MGVIKKTLFRGNILGKPRHRNLFLDMEENIHIHYRDLRIELSRGEFEDIVSAFTKQAQELQAIIEEKHYQDGKLPNANQDDVRIWTESRLKHEVKYHPQRFSLEECGDGYHFHYRNYKLLIDPAEFRQLAQLFRSLDVDGPYASTYDEVLELLETNDVDFMLDAGNVPGEKLAIAVAQHHMPKIRDIFAYIGFTQEAEGEVRRYAGPRLAVTARPEKQRSALDYKRLRGYNEVGRLVDFLARSGASLDANELNRIKCQVLDLYFALKSGQALHVESDPQLWLYSHGNGQVIFPYSPTPRGKDDAETLYKAWSALLLSLQMNFVKPTKAIFTPQQQAALKEQVAQAMRREIAAFGAVDRVYYMGSALRGEMGRYQAPFVHGKMAKLGSDIDILVEINPAREGDIPAHWQLINPKASNHCAVYHTGEIPLADGPGEWPQRHPHVTFTQHLLDVYVSFPSQGFAEEKAAFLKKFGAKLFYDRARDGVLYPGDEEERIAGRLAQLHGITQAAVEKMKVSTENALYKVFAGEHDYILKLFKVSGNYHRTRVAEHTAYEESLVSQIKARGVPTAGVIPASGGAGDTTIEGYSALLFERLPGAVQQRPEYPLERICPALAQFHRVQRENPLDLAQTFLFDDVCMIWLPLFEEYLHKPDLEAGIAQLFDRLAPLAERCFPGEKRAALFARSPSVHCHGDVTPKNVIVSGENTCFFDFNNAYFGPRMADVIDGAFQFSLAEKFVHLADFARFDAFVAHYDAAYPLSAEEMEDLPHWIELLGIIQFTKEIRVLLQGAQESLRRKRALALAEFILARCR